jgi:hypothetical protein
MTKIKRYSRAERRVTLASIVTTPVRYISSYLSIPARLIGLVPLLADASAIGRSD